MGSGPFVFTQPNADIDLTNLDLVHQYVSVKGGNTSQDTLIQLCITAASFQFIWWTGRGPQDGSAPAESPFVTPVAYDEIYDGNGSYRLPLRNWPAQSVTSLTVNGQLRQPSTGFGIPGYLIDSSRRALVCRTAGRQSPYGRAIPGIGFDLGVQNVEAVYMAGFSSTPADIVKAVTHLVAINFKRTQWLDQASKTIGAQGVSGTDSYRAWEVPPEVMRVIRYYSRDYVA